MVALGSSGDVYPHIGIGRALRHRGHQVLVITSSHFEKPVRDAGLEFLSCVSAEESRAAAENPDLFKFGKGFRVFFDGIVRATPEVYRLVSANYVPGQTVVISGFAGFGARIAHEKLGIPLVTLHLQPVLLRTLNEQPGVVISSGARPLIRPLRRMLLAALDRWAFDPVLLPGLNAFRAELGLAPVSRPLQSWVHSPQLVIGLFPEWFANLQPDWPRNTRLTGFPLFDQVEQLPGEVEEFLNAGEPPVVFTAGTAMLFGRKFFQVSTEACLAINRRGLLVTPFPEQVPPALPQNMRHVKFAPFSALLPRAAGLVHHGGIGTVAQAFAAGIPQLVVPFNFDQPDNATRVKRTGAGDSIRTRLYRPKIAALKLERLLSSQTVLENCRSLAARMKQTDAIAATIDLIETLNA